MINAFLVMLFTSLAEILLYHPLFLLSSISNQQNLSENKIIVMILNFFNLNSQDNLILYSSIIFILAILISSSFRLLNIWLNARLAAVIGSDFILKLMKIPISTIYKSLKEKYKEVISASTTKISYTIRFISSALQIGTAIMISTGIFIGLLLRILRPQFLTSIIESRLLPKTTNKNY